jgi:hypothetical protein
MNRTLTLTLALAAGLFGGLLSHYVAPMPVHAQAQYPGRSVRKTSCWLTHKVSKLGFWALILRGVRSSNWWTNGDARSGVLGKQCSSRNPNPVRNNSK